MSELKQLEYFQPHVGSTFTLLDDNGHSLSLTLSEATPVGAPKPDGGGKFRSQQFSLLFTGPEDYILPQRVYSLEHADIDKLDLFLVPVGPGQYEAVFT